MTLSRDKKDESSLIVIASASEAIPRFKVKRLPRLLRSLAMTDKICLFIAFLPFIHIATIFNGYEFPKFVALIFFSAILGVMYFFHLGGVMPFERLRAATFEVILQRWSLIKLVFVYVAWVFISNIFGVDPLNSFLGGVYRHQGFITLLSCVVIFLIVRTLKIDREEIFSTFVKYITISTAVLVGLSLVQGVLVYFYNSGEIITYQGRIVATLGNPNFLGGYLVMALPLVLHGVSRVSRVPRVSRGGIIKFEYQSTKSETNSNDINIKFKKMFLFIRKFVFRTLFRVSTRLAEALTKRVFEFRIFYEMIKLVQYGIYRTLITVGILVAILFTQSRSAMIAGGAVLFVLFLHLAKRYIGILGMLLVVVLTVILSYFSMLYIQRNSIWDNRGVIWQEGLKLIWERPIIGYGQENFGNAFPKKLLFNVDNTHNIFLETVVSSGIVGLLLFSAILVYGVWKASYPVKASLVVFVIIAQFNPLSLVHISLFWFLLGLSGGSKLPSSSKL